VLAALATQIRVILTEIAQREVEAGQAEDIPKQDNSSWYRQQKSNVITPFQSSTTETLGTYRIGQPSRPSIRHDDGFSKFPKAMQKYSITWRSTNGR